MFLFNSFNISLILFCGRCIKMCFKCFVVTYGKNILLCQGENVISDTIAAIITAMVLPCGHTIRISGPDALKIGCSVYQGKTNLLDIPSTL